jgi:hypothetical protein
MRFVTADFNAPTIVDNDRGWGLPNDRAAPSIVVTDNDGCVGFRNGDDASLIVVAVGARHAVPLPLRDGISPIFIGVCAGGERRRSIARWCIIDMQ